MIGEIENAIIKRIETASKNGDLGYRYKKVASYGGELSDQDQLLKSVVDFPFCLVLFTGMQRKRVVGGRSDVTASFTVIVGARSLRNESDGRKGSSSQPGTYQLGEDVIALLVNQNLGQKINAFQFVRMDPLLNDKAKNGLASIYGLEFSTGFVTPADVDTSSLDDFETFHANWDVPAHGNVGPGLPDDLHADATTTVTLESE